MNNSIIAGILQNIITGQYDIETGILYNKLITGLVWIVYLISVCVIFYLIWEDNLYSICRKIKAMAGNFKNNFLVNKFIKFFENEMNVEFVAADEATQNKLDEIRKEYKADDQSI